MIIEYLRGGATVTRHAEFIPLIARGESRPEADQPWAGAFGGESSFIWNVLYML